MNVISPFVTFLLWTPVFLGGLALLWYAIRKHLWLNREMKEDEREDQEKRDVRNILNGQRTPTAEDTYGLILLLQEDKVIMDRLNHMADRDPVMDLSLQDLRSALREQSIKLEQRGIR